jgi:hypothetical protein
MQASIFHVRVVAIICCIFVFTGCLTRQRKEVMVSPMIIRLKGSARYSLDGQTWKPVKLAKEVKIGGLIQTAEDSTVDLALEDYAAFDRERNRANLVRVQADSLLRIDSVKWHRSGKWDAYISEIKLSILRGSIAGLVRSMAEGSTYEVAFTEGIARIEQGPHNFQSGYSITSDGDAGSYEDSITEIGKDGQVIVKIPVGYQYDSKSRITLPLPPPGKIIGYPDHVPVLEKPRRF